MALENIMEQGENAGNFCHNVLCHLAKSNHQDHKPKAKSLSSLVNAYKLDKSTIVSSVKEIYISR